MHGNKNISKVLYLHDTPRESGNHVAANKSNIDIIESVETCLKSQSDVVLSADDGYKSVKNLLPILEKYNVKLLLFVTTGFVDRSVYPYEVEVSNFLEKNDYCKHEGKKIKLNTVYDKENFFQKVHRQLKALPLSEREQILNEFFVENNVNGKSFQVDTFMNWDEVREIAVHPLVEVGSHCVSHVFLPSQRLGVIFRELKDSKKRLEHELGYDVTKLSYPYGGNDFIVRTLARILGYKQAYGTHQKQSKNMNRARIELK